MAQPMRSIPITDLMNRDIDLVPPETPVRELVARMRARRQSCVVVGRDGVPEGVITERDLVVLLDRLATEPDALARTATEIMSAPPNTLSADQTLFDALVISRAERVRHLPVIDADHKLVGMVTYTNLAEAHFHVIERQHHTIEQAVADRTASLREANEQLLRLSLEDGLLGIGNRRAMEVDIEHTHQAALRYRRTYSVVLLDIDHFKRYNDHYGHPRGDECLLKVCAFLKAAIRTADRLYRYGGEEFLLLLPDTDLTGGAHLCRRLVERLHRLALPHCASPFGVVTMSTGIASCAGDGPAGAAWREVVARADAQLYEAKTGGRNRAA